MGENTEKYAGINVYEGGYFVSLDGRVVITTSLNKAIKLVRDHLAVAGDAAE